MNNNNLVQHAITYIDSLKWSLCQVNGKAPFVDGWQTKELAINNPDIAKSVWHNARFGIGLVHEQSMTGVFDVDDIECSRIVFDEFGINLDDLLNGYPRIKGKDGRAKIVFKMPEVLPTLKLVWPGKDTESKKTITVFELRCRGGQDVLPPSIHPDLKKPYEWIVAPWDLDEIPEVPNALLVLWKAWKDFEPQLKSACPWMPATLLPKPVQKRTECTTDGVDVIGQYNNANHIINVLERNGYTKKGKRWLSPTSSSNIPGVIVFDDGKCFSHHASDPLNNGYAHDAFGVYLELECNGDIKKAVKNAASELGITFENKIPPVDIVDFVDNIGKNTPCYPMLPHVKKEPYKPTEFPVPILNDLMYWMESLEELPSRMITMQGVLAANATLGGRLYKSAGQNDSSLYLMTLAETGKGKGYPAKAIKNLFNAAGLSKLIAGSGNTSSAAIFSALRRAPCHLQISDEIGKQYSAARKASGGNLAEAFAQLTIAYSDTDSIMMPRNYSEVGLKKSDIDNLPNQYIVNPSITLFSFATFEQVFNALTLDDIDDGFLNRQIIVNSDDELLPYRERRSNTPPAHIIAWAKAMRSPNKFDDGENLAGLDTAYDMQPSQIYGIMSDAVKTLFKEFKLDVLKLSGDKLKIAIRWNENAMRLAHGLAVAVNQLQPEITPILAEWAINYVHYHGLRLFTLVEQNIAGNDIHRLRNQVFKAIDNAGMEGRKLSQLYLYCRLWKQSTTQQCEQAIEGLKRDELIFEMRQPVKPGPGRKPVPLFFSKNFVKFN